MLMTDDLKSHFKVILYSRISFPNLVTDKYAWVSVYIKTNERRRQLSPGIGHFV